MSPFINKLGQTGWMVVRAETFVAHNSKKHAEHMAEEMNKLFPHSLFYTVAVKIDGEFKPQSSLLGNQAIDALGTELKSLLSPRERVMQLEILPPDYDCDSGSFKLTISDGEYQGVSHSCLLSVAIEMARAKLRREREETEPQIVQVQRPVIQAPPKKSAIGLSIKKKV